MWLFRAAMLRKPKCNALSGPLTIVWRSHNTQCARAVRGNTIYIHIYKLFNADKVHIVYTQSAGDRGRTPTTTVNRQNEFLKDAQYLLGQRHIMMRASRSFESSLTIVRVVLHPFALYYISRYHAKIYVGLIWRNRRACAQPHIPLKWWALHWPWKSPTRIRQGFVMPIMCSVIIIEDKLLCVSARFQLSQYIGNEMC